MHPRRTVLSQTVILLWLGAVACSTSESADGEGGQGTGADSSTGGVGGDAAGGAGGAGGSAPSCQAALGGECGACMQDACCEALQGCEADPACLACVQGEDGAACESSPETHERVDAYLTCRGGPCAEPCIGGTEGSCLDLLDGVVASGCQTCLEASCCEEVAACHSSEGCWVDCLTEFTEAGCHADANGHALFHALNACIAAQCSVCTE